MPALVALTLLPGLVIVRAPWTAVPFLSLSFWLVSWWWLPGPLGRHRFLLGMLVSCAALASLRLLKPLGLRRPSWPAALVVAAALARLVPALAWPVAPGAGAAEHTLAALLMVWRDGIPASCEPLAPLEPFRADAAGLHGLAADLALLSGLPAARSLLVAAVAAQGLLQVALFAFLARFFSAPAAALASIAGLALLGWPDPAAVLALALFLSATALLSRGLGRPAAVAAGVFLAATLVADATLASVSWLLVLLALEAALRRGAAERRTVIERFALAGGVALTAALPFLLRARFSIAPGRKALPPLLAVTAAMCLAPLVEGLLGRGERLARLALALLLALAVADTGRGLVAARGDVALSSDELEAMAWIRTHTRPLDVVCPEDTGTGGWIPAVAERANRPRQGRACSLLYVAGPPKRPGRIVYRNASVTIIEPAPP